jgi:hypothetical protein
MRCAVCPSRAVHRHHVLSRQFLKREGYGDRMNDPRNILDLCFDCHMSHENWSRRVTREQLPHECFAFAREIGELAVCRIERDYPVRDRPASAAGDVRA